MRRLAQLRDDARQSMAEEVLRQCGIVRMRVLGGSMLPSIWPGELITVRRQPAEELLIGDVGLFRKGDRLFAHRIRKIVTIRDSIYFITRGDSVPYNDPPFHYTELLGKVIAIQRNDQRRVPACPLSLYARVAGWILCHCNRLRALSLRFRPCFGLDSARRSAEQMLDS